MPDAAIFMGARVRDVSVSLGWGMGQAGQLTIQLVDDPVLGYAFEAPVVGTPAYFSLGGLTFNGLVQKWDRQGGLDGNPAYSVSLVDPRELLEAPVLTGGYNGNVGGLRNLFNAYGYWENLGGFGAARSNDAGMPWELVRQAVTVLANTPAVTPFGGPLTLKGVSYGLDLSQLPAMAADYRVGGGGSASLLEIVAQVCEDGGCDFFVELAGATVRVRTVPRFGDAPLGTITQLVETSWPGQVVRYGSGVELRNELTAAMLVGGERMDLLQTDDVRQFWGYDADGAPVLSYAWQFDFPVTQPDGSVVTQTVDTEAADLNGDPVADIIGSRLYACSTLEMRLAQAGYESWATFLSTYRAEVAELAGVESPFAPIAAVALGQAPVRAGAVNDAPDSAALVTAAAVEGDLHDTSLRLFEFVRGYADEYMGRQYVVGLPFVQSSTDPETLQTTLSYEVADAGYLPDGAEPLGLSDAGADLFRSPDGRVRSFSEYDDLVGADLSRVNPQASVIEDGVLYAGVQVDPRLILVGGVPSAVLTTSSAVTDQSPDNVGDIGLVSKILQCEQVACQAFLQQCAVPFRIAPAVRHPAAVTVPLKSNVERYGPWFAQGATGKVRAEHDPSLTPWQYGGYDTLNAAATARVASAVTTLQAAETGYVERAGVPEFSPGDVLLEGGPNLTAVDVRYGDGGATTTYRFQTFTPRFGVAGKAVAERTRRAALLAGELRRGLRVALKRQGLAAEAVVAGRRTRRAWNESQAKAFKRETPSDTFVSYSAHDAPTGYVRQNTGMTTLEEAVVLSNANSPSGYQATAVMSLNGLLRPFSATPAFGSGLMPSFTPPALAGVANSTTLNPFASGTDVEVYAWGSGYQGLHAFRRGGDPATARALALRAPLLLSGWGVSVDGEPVPGSGTAFHPDTLARQDLWKVGPVDHLWDDARGVWTSHDLFRGTAAADIAAAASGQLVLPNSGGRTLGVYNPSADPVPSGTTFTAYYAANENRLLALTDVGSSAPEYWYAVLTSGPSNTAGPFSWKERVMTSAGTWADGTRSGTSNAYFALTAAGLIPSLTAGSDIVLMRASTTVSGKYEFVTVTDQNRIVVNSGWSGFYSIPTSTGTWTSVPTPPSPGSGFSLPVTTPGSQYLVIHNLVGIVGNSAASSISTRLVLDGTPLTNGERLVVSSPAGATTTQTATATWIITPNGGAGAVSYEFKRTGSGTWTQSDVGGNSGNGHLQVLRLK